MTPDERWLAVTWPFVREHLPSPPARILEIGCGPLGGFVPQLQAHGYDPVGIDPAAPGPATSRSPSSGTPRPSPWRGSSPAPRCTTSLTWTTSWTAWLAPWCRGGVLVVVEWAWERFDGATARWCFARLPDGDGDSWLHRHHEAWQASGRPWDGYIKAWSQDERLHTGQHMMRGLRARFDTRLLEEGPYFFCELADVTTSDEQAAIDSDHIQANGIRYIGYIGYKSADLTPPGS
jgi:hypothetical protein